MENNEPHRMSKQEAFEKMVNLLDTRYNASCQKVGKKYMVTTYDGGDGGDLQMNGTYEYDFGESVSFRNQTEEEIIRILDEYFEI